MRTANNPLAADHEGRRGKLAALLWGSVAAAPRGC